MRMRSNRPVKIGQDEFAAARLPSGEEDAVVAERVNASVDIIEAHYDRTDEVTQFEQRKRQHLDKLDQREDDDA